jgi:NAD-dependent deacetylase
MTPQERAFFGFAKGSRPLAVVLTGAGISAESGLKTFRDAGGLWENHNVMEMASIEGWFRNPELVLRFYNERRKQAVTAQPNEGHRALKRLEEKFEVVVVTQNVDNLHEKAGSSQVLHLHGELTKVRSWDDPNYIVDIGDGAINLGDKAPDGGQLRPHIVWFGEDVPMYGAAARIAALADVFLIVGTSLAVYPAAGLIDEVPAKVPKFLVDPHLPSVNGYHRVEMLGEAAGTGVPKVVEKLFAMPF